MRYVLLALLSAGVAIRPVHAQVVPSHGPQTSLYLESLGNGGLYSINVDRVLPSGVVLRAGVATWNSADILGGGDSNYLTLPLTAGYLVGRGSGKLELGFGVLLGRRFDPGEGFASLTGTLGYRYQRSGGGTMFRLGLTPFLALNDGSTAYPDAGFFPSFGGSVGYAFPARRR